MCQARFDGVETLVDSLDACRGIVRSLTLGSSCKPSGVAVGMAHPSWTRFCKRNASSNDNTIVIVKKVYNVSGGTWIDDHKVNPASQRIVKKRPRPPVFDCSLVPLPHAELKTMSLSHARCAFAHSSIPIKQSAAHI